jgi:hypothetical protein
VLHEMAYGGSLVRGHGEVVGETTARVVCVRWPAPGLGNCPLSAAGVVTNEGGGAHCRTTSVKSIPHFHDEGGLTGGDVGAVDREGRRVPRSVIIHEQLVLVKARVGIARVVPVGDARISTRKEDAYALES